MRKPKKHPLLQLVQESRLRESTSGTRGNLIASESDKGRVINTASFRRLQQKAQVFPLEPNAAVRTRLTHSLEVSQTGRHIAQKIIEKIKDLKKSPYEDLAAFVNVVETACLLHDIGNPPFGHLGEAAIRDWFKSREVKLEDLVNFDGNPQGFRLISYLNGKDDYGLNLTATLLLSTVKYPITSKQKTEDKLEGKIGIFDSEYSKYTESCDHIKWPHGKKFPFMQLMDAADGIAYAMSDLEDGLEKGIIVVEDDLDKNFGKKRFISTAIDGFINFKTGVINDAVETAANCFVSNIDEILSGEDIDLIDREKSEVGDLLSKVKSFARSRIYSHESVEKIELAGRSALHGLLDYFSCLLDLPYEDFHCLMRDDHKSIRAKHLDFHVRLLHRIPKNYRDKYEGQKNGDEATRRAHLIIDFISGMTDDFALDTYQILQGIKIK